MLGDLGDCKLGYQASKGLKTMFNSAKAVLVNVNAQLTSSGPYLGYTPVASRLGPLVNVPYTTDGHVAWGASWALVLCGLAVVRDSYGHWSVGRAARAANRIMEV